jgi:regulator of sigma E protease
MEILILVGQIIVGLLLLSLLVVIHELGHAIAARRNGVVVEEFGIGFPPRAFGRDVKRNTWLGINGLSFISLNWMPLGGFVKLQGETDDASKKGDYGAASLWAKTKILLAGVFMNWVTAAVLFTILALVGFPKVIPDQFTVASDTVTTREPLKIAYVEPASPADKAGIRKDDTLIAVAGQQLRESEELVAATHQRKGEVVSVVIERSGVEKTYDIALRSSPGKNQGVLGVNAVSQTFYRSSWSAPIVGIGTTVQFSVVTLQGIGDLFVKLGSGIAAQLSGDQATRQKGSEALSQAGASVAGPIGILGVIFPAAQEAGLTMLIFLIGVISLTLAVMNVLPIPALDGGRLFVTLIFRVIKKPLTKEKEELIHGAGFNFLLLLIVIITIADVFKFF